MDKEEILEILEKAATSYMGGFTAIPDTDFEELAEMLEELTKK